MKPFLLGLICVILVVGLFILIMGWGDYRSMRRARLIREGKLKLH